MDKMSMLGCFKVLARRFVACLVRAGGSGSLDVGLVACRRRADKHLLLYREICMYVQYAV